jgi:superfamily II helicase
MKTKEELLVMSHEELAEYAYGCQTNASLYDYSRKQCDRLKEILSSIGIAYETYKRENQ